jgi:hypothetical protein
VASLSKKFCGIPENAALFQLPSFEIGGIFVAETGGATEPELSENNLDHSSRNCRVTN